MKKLIIAIMIISSIIFFMLMWGNYNLSIAKINTKVLETLLPSIWTTPAEKEADYQKELLAKKSGGQLRGGMMSGLGCGSGACSYQYASGTVVTLTATCNNGYHFTGWTGGGCEVVGTNPQCAVTMGSNGTETDVTSHCDPTG
jgi:uncharacterized repeat protein (TIGR02543 family)